MFNNFRFSFRSMSALRILLVLGAVISLHSCEVINPSEQVPTYLHIDSFRFLPTPNSGTLSHKITSVAAYLDYAPLGIFDLPADIPVLTGKSGSLLLTPCVVYSGLSDIIVPYSFYRSDTSTLQPAPGQRMVYQPQTRYFDDNVLNFTHEDFESGNSFVQLEGDTLRRTSDPQYVFEGSYGGLIQLDSTDYSLSVMSIPFSGSVNSSNRAEAYLELNYKGTLNFEIGVQTTKNGVTQSQFLYGFRPKGDWNKVYVGLQDFLTNFQGGSYNILVRVAETKPVTGYVAFDNFKIVTRK